MLPLHLLFAISVAIIWGLNFIFIKLALTTFSPILLSALRFTLCSIPAIFFIKRPQVPILTLCAYGIIMFALQFTMLFLGIYSGMTPGMASLIAQVQVFFTMFFAVLFLKEYPTQAQFLGAIVAFSGIILVATHMDSHQVTPLGFIFILMAAASWGCGNLITKKMRHANGLALIVWGSFIASIPLITIALIIDGPSQILQTLHHTTLLSASALCYIVFVSTWVGYGLWNWLLAHYPVGAILPFTLLVPVVGIISSVLMFHEPVYSWKIIAILLVMAGLSVTILSSRLQLQKARV